MYQARSDMTGGWIPVRRLALMTTAAVMVLAGGTQTAGSAVAAVPVPAAVTLTGSVGHLPAGRAVILVEAEIAAGRLPDRPRAAPGHLYGIVVATATISGPAFRIAVPQSAALRRAGQLNHGTVNFILIADSGPRTTSPGFPVPLTPQARPGNVAAAAIVRTRVFRVPGLPRFVPMSARRWASVTALMRAPAWAPADTTRCVWSDYQGSWEKVTPIGQAHVAANAGITVDYELNYTDNLYVNFGGASAGNGPFSGVGNITLSENFGISGGATFGGTSAGLRNYLGSQYL